MLSAMVVGVTNKLNMSASEEKSYLILIRLGLNKTKTQLAVKLIDHWLYCCLLHRKDKLHLNSKLVSQIRDIAREFKSVRR